MTRQVVENILALIRSVIDDTGADNIEKQTLDGDSLKALFSLAKKHDIAHLTAYALIKNNLIGKENELYSKINKEQLTAVYRYEQINYSLIEISNALETAQIPFIPLKGAVIRKYYPEPWMRTSCDIDVLVKREDLDDAITYLTESVGYKKENTGSHDVSLFTPSGTHIELHYALVEEGIVNSADKVLSGVWEDSTVKTGCKYQREMSSEMFYFYHIAHMVKHFLHGGCGVRSVLDLWFLDNKVEYNIEKQNKLLEDVNLITFANAMRNLSKVWFDRKESDKLSDSIQKYIFYGGIYGNQENRISIGQSKRGDKFRYAISRIFLPYEELKYHYPILKKHRILTPLYEVRRWFRVIFCGSAKRVVKELKTNKNLTEEQKSAAADLLKQLDI